MKLIGLLLIAGLVSCSPAHAKMCKAVNGDGDEVFMWATDTNGKLMKTKSASGVVATMEACPLRYNIELERQTLTGVKLRAEDIRGVEVAQPLPIDRNEFLHESCKRTLSAVCDPEYGGMKLYPNPSVTSDGVIEANCIGFKISSGADEGGQIKYAFPQMYGAWKVRPDGSQYCEFDK